MAWKTVGVATVVLAASLAWGQKTPIFHAQAELVQVPVTVLGHKDKFIRGLKRQDFRLEVDGKPVPVVAVDPMKPPQPAPLPPMPTGVYSNQNVRQPAARIVLLYDYDHIQIQYLSQLRARVMRWIQHSMKPHQQVAVFALSNGLEVLQPFTSNRAALEATLHTMVSFHASNNRYAALKVELDQLDAEAGVSSGPPATAPESPGGGASNMTLRPNGMIAASAQWSAADLQRVENLAVRGQYYSAMRGLEDLAQVLEGVPGRKIVVWLTTGTSINAIWNPRQDLTGKELRTVFARLNQADVALFPVDVGGLRPMTLPPSADPRFDNQTKRVGITREVEHATKLIAMTDAAERTGGQAYSNSNGFGRILTHIVQTTSQGYVLSFVPPEPRKGHPYRTVKVSVPGQHVDLLYRKQYLQPAMADAEQTQATFVKSLPRLALAPMDMGSLPLVLRTAPPAAAKPVIWNGLKKKVMTSGHGFVLVIPYQPLLHAAAGAAGGYAFDFTCYRTLLPLDHPGEPLVFPSSRFQHALTAPQEQKLAGQAAIYRNVFPVPEGHVYLARVLVRDNLTGQLGSVSFRIDTRKGK